MSHKLIFISYYFLSSTLTLSWRRPLSYRNQSIDIWFLYDNGPRHERVKWNTIQYNTTGSHETFELIFIESFQEVSVVKRILNIYSWYFQIIYTWWGLFILDMDGEFSNFLYFLRQDFFANLKLVNFLK